MRDVAGTHIRHAYSASEQLRPGLYPIHTIVLTASFIVEMLLIDLAIADLTSLPHISIATLGVDSCPLSW